MDSNTIIKGIQKVTGDWAKQKKREEREASARYSRRDYLYREPKTSIRDAAFEIMHEAYMKASAGGTLPAHARQIMYAARGHILKKTKLSALKDAYFTQTLLPQYIDEHVGARAWDVVYDARGHFQEPHSWKGVEVALGTLEVRDYLARIDGHEVRAPSAAVAHGDRFPTCGPRHRFGAVLFIEKEGFMPLLDRVQLARRFDLAIMSTKGFSNVASRILIDTVCGAHGIPLLVLHDFDVSGFGIVNTLRDSTRRYFYEHEIEVIDLGLRLEDIQKHPLEAERVHHRRSFSTLGMTKAEAEFLQTRRVELNAFTSDALVAFIEGKLRTHGVGKVIPDTETLADAYRRAVHVEHLERAIDKARRVARKVSKNLKVPKDLKRRIEAALRRSPDLSWDAAIRGFVKNDGSGNRIKQA